MTDSEYEQAFMRWWTKDFPLKEYDRAIDGFNRIKHVEPVEKIGWLRAARESLMISAEAVASELDVSAAGYSKLEQSEAEGKITLERLAAAAEAMDCELVYAIRPKKRVRFSQMIWQKLVGQAQMNPWVDRSPKATKPAALAMIASKLFRDPDFRRKQGWKKRRKK